MKQGQSQKEEPGQENHRDPLSEIPSPVHTDILMGVSAFLLGGLVYSFVKGWFFLPASISHWIGWPILALTFELLLLMRVITRFRTFPLEAYAPLSSRISEREKWTKRLHCTLWLLSRRFS